MLPIRCFDQGGRLGCARSVAAPVNTLSCRRLQLSTIDTAESRLVLQGAGHGPITFEVEPRDLIHLASHFTAAGRPSIRGAARVGPGSPLLR
jgi:hypothetical protein